MSYCANSFRSFDGVFTSLLPYHLPNNHRKSIIAILWHRAPAYPQFVIALRWRDVIVPAPLLHVNRTCNRVCERPLYRGTEVDCGSTETVTLVDLMLQLFRSRPIFRDDRENAPSPENDPLGSPAFLNPKCSFASISGTRLSTLTLNLLHIWQNYPRNFIQF